MYCDSIGENGVVFKTGGFTINVISTPIITEVEQEININKQIKISPNPTSNHLKIIAKDLDVSEINVINISGKIIETYKSNLDLINVSDLPSGIYFINFITNERIVIKKFIKQ